MYLRVLRQSARLSKQSFGVSRMPLPMHTGSLLSLFSPAHQALAASSPTPWAPQAHLAVACSSSPPQHTTNPESSAHASDPAPTLNGSLCGSLSFFPLLLQAQTVSFLTPRGWRDTVG